MSQTGLIFGALLVGFIVYVTLKGELPAYAAVLFGPGKNTVPAAGTGTTVSPNVPAGLGMLSPTSLVSSVTL